MEAVRQGVQQEAPDELISRKSHELGLAVMAIILPAEGDFGIGQADQAGVGDGDAVCVSAEIGEHLSRSIVRMIARNAASLPSRGSRSGAHMLRPPAARPSVRARRSGCRRVYRRIRSNQNPATIAAGGGHARQRRRPRWGDRCGDPVRYCADKFADLIGLRIISRAS